MKQTQDSFLNRSLGWVKSHATWDNAMKAGAVTGGALALGGAGAAFMAAETVPAALGAVGQGIGALSEIRAGVRGTVPPPNRVWTPERGYHMVS